MTSNILKENGWVWEEEQEQEMEDQKSEEKGFFEAVAGVIVAIVMCVSLVYAVYDWSKDFSYPLQTAIEKEIQGYKDGKNTFVKTASNISSHIIFYSLETIFQSLKVNHHCSLCLSGRRKSINTDRYKIVYPYISQLTAPLTPYQ